MSFFIPNFFISGVHISRRACTFLWVYTHFLYFGEQSWLIVSWGRNTWEKKPLLCQFLRKCLWDLRLFNILNYFQCWDSIQPYISCLSYNFLFKGFTSNSSHVVRFFLWFIIHLNIKCDSTSLDLQSSFAPATVQPHSVSMSCSLHICTADCLLYVPRWLLIQEALSSSHCAPVMRCQYFIYLFILVLYIKTNYFGGHRF